MRFKIFSVCDAYKKGHLTLHAKTRKTEKLQKVYIKKYIYMFNLMHLFPHIKVQIEL